MFSRKKVENIPSTIQYKWSAEVTDEGFVPFPKRLLRCLARAFESKDLELLQVVLSIVDFNRPNLLQLPSMDFLAFVAGLDKEVFRSRLNELKEMGLVEVHMDHDPAVAVSIRGLLNRVEELTQD